MAIRRFLRVVCLLAGMPAAAESLELVTGNDYPPYTGETLRDGGIATAIVKAVLAEMHQDYKLHWMSWVRGYQYAKDNAFAATFPYLKTPERERDFLYSDPIMTISERLYAKPGKWPDPHDRASLQGKRVCRPTGWATTGLVDEMIRNKSLVLFTPYEMTTCVKLVAIGRVDFFVSDVFQGRQSVAAAGFSEQDVAPGPVPLDSKPLYLMASKQSPLSAPWLERFNRALKALRERHLYDEILARYQK
jgi:polar amino acid transport system substrate-binding protein